MGAALHVQLEAQANDAEFRPFIGIFLIAAMVAILGVVVGILFPETTESFITTSIWIVVFGGVCICVKTILSIAKHFFINKNP